MAELKTSGLKIVSGHYNFLNDPSVGAVGNIRLGVYLPKLSQIVGFWVTEITAITSGGAATLSFGTIVNPATATNNNLMAATAIASFTSQPLIGVDLNATPLKITSDVEIIMAIGTAALTAGELMFVLHYNENLV